LEAVTALRAEVERLAAQAAPTEDAMWNQTLQERDTYHDWADKLAEGIAAHLGIEIGEHSAGMGSAESNNPWANALEAIQSAAQSAPQAQGQDAAPAEQPQDNELLADTPTPKPQDGMWILTAPDGRTYQADSPQRCCGLEQRERVPADVAMARILRASSEPDDSELLDWLDATNKRFKMGWEVGVSPAGNCRVQSVICLGNSEPVTIRAAIRAARAKE